ncbi:uncharacterized protein LOC125775189 isoform X2 [Anopheles funestus]|uniref:uncharacterized protein LOC125775189 isoform X2 n=1 Tax=Anopheles funestus TaxID=62324 RepID=UPI0020C5FB62|nr:uncharacterized protein LOC125775189 isoform X2 [Anopheles funestus]
MRMETVGTFVRLMIWRKRHKTEEAMALTAMTTTRGVQCAASTLVRNIASGLVTLVKVLLKLVGKLSWRSSESGLPPTRMDVALTWDGVNLVSSAHSASEAADMITLVVVPTTATPIRGRNREASRSITIGQTAQCWGGIIAVPITAKAYFSLQTSKPAVAVAGETVSSFTILALEREVEQASTVATIVCVATCIIRGHVAAPATEQHRTQPLGRQGWYVRRTLAGGQLGGGNDGVWFGITPRPTMTYGRERSAVEMVQY